MDYTNQNLIENHLQRSLTTDEVAMLPVLKRAITLWLNRKTDSNFAKVGATTKIFDGGDSVLDIQPASSITSIAYLDDLGAVSSTYETSDYVNEADENGIISQISKRYGLFAHGKGNIAVTGVFSEYNEANGGVPEDIQLIATTVAATVIKGQSDAAEAPTGVKAESIEGHNIQYGSTAETFDSIAKPGSVIDSLLQQRRQILVG